MQARALKLVVLGTVLLVGWVGALGQSGGDGSVLIRDGNGAATQGEDAGVRVSQGVMAGLLTSKPDPDQLVARRMHLSGTVVMAVRVDKDGRVAKATAISGPEPLRDPALEAVRRWTYKPYLLNGQAVAVATTVTIMFYPGK